MTTLSRRPRLVTIQRGMARVALAGALAAVLACGVLVGLAIPASSAPIAPAGGCSAGSDPVPANMGGRPVIYVHGWLSSADSSKTAVELLRQQLGAGFEVFAFDYSDLHSSWPVGNWASECLAEYIQSLSSAYEQSGGKGGVLAVGHSMGGIALRSAAAALDAGGRSAELAGIVTLGTPHQGSPWGGSDYATFYDEVHRFGTAAASFFKLVPAGTDAAICLSAMSQQACSPAPYVPEKTMVATVGTQLIIQRKLFDLPFVEEETADIALFGDVIVPADSANGYPGSAIGKTRGEFMGAHTEQCPESSSYLSKELVGATSKLGLLPGIIASELGAIFQIWNDNKAMDGFAAGTASINQVPLMVIGMQSDCFHSNLPDFKAAQAQVANYLVEMNSKLPSGTSDITRGERRWLYDVTSSGAAGSGSRTGQRLGQDGGRFPNSTAQWVGCEGAASVQTYNLGGNYKSLSATVGQRLGTPKDIGVEYVVTTDNVEVLKFTLRSRHTQAISVDLTGVRALNISAKATTGICASSTEAYGVLGDAYLQATAADAGSGVGDTASSPAASNGWPVWRHDEYPGLSIWFGAAAATGRNDIGLPKWVSCFEDVCLIGNQDQVGVVVKRPTGFEMVYQFSADVDARQKLAEIKASDEEIDGLLKK